MVYFFIYLTWMLLMFSIQKIIFSIGYFFLNIQYPEQFIFGYIAIFFLFWLRIKKMPHIHIRVFFSSLLAWLANCLASLDTTGAASLCHPPRAWTTTGRNLIPSALQAWKDLVILSLYLLAAAFPSSAAALFLYSCWREKFGRSSDSWSFQLLTTF